jgi:hypothetical protein
MPVTWRFDASEPFAVVCLTDPCTLEEWQAAYLRLLDDRQFQTYRTVLVDRRHAAPATTEFVNGIINFMDAHRGQVAERTALLVGNDTSFGMSRMTQLIADARHPELKIGVFRSREEAAAWLSAKR